MTTFSRTAMPRRNEDLVARETGEEIYVCSADGQTMYTLTEVAADIWRACDGQQTIDDIAELLLMAYEIDRETLLADLQSCLEDLESKKLIIFH